MNAKADTHEASDISQRFGSRRRFVWSLVWILLAGSLLIGIYRALPADEINIYSGPVGGTYYKMALTYRDRLEQSGYAVNILPSDSTAKLLDNVNDSDKPNTIGFLIGEINRSTHPNIRSLGFVDMQPLFLFYSNAYGELVSLATLKGRPLVMPPKDSVTAQIGLKLLSLYGINEQNTPISFLPFQEAVDALKRGDDYALFLMLGAEHPVVAELMTDSELNAYSYRDTSGILKKLNTLTPVTLEPGSYDVLRQIPPKPIKLLGGQVEMITHETLDKAAAYALLNTFENVHHSASLTNDVGTYPTFMGLLAEPYPVTQNFSKTGTPWLYRTFNNKIATLIDNYLIIGLAIFLLTEIYRTLRYLYEFLVLSAETTALGVIRRHAKRTQSGKPTGWLNQLLKQWAESVIKRKSIRQQASEMLAKRNESD